MQLPQWIEVSPIVACGEVRNKNNKEPIEIDADQQKVDTAVEEIQKLANTIIRFEKTAKTAVSWIIKVLKEHNLFIRWRSAIKHRTSLNKEAGLPDRVVWMRKQFLGTNG